MANPQKEEGFAPIANEILESIYRTHFSSTELPVILWVWRYTYGWLNRKTCSFSWAKIARDIGASERHVRRVGVKLVNDGILYIGTTGEVGYKKDYDQWKNCGGKRTQASGFRTQASGQSGPIDRTQRTRKGGHSRPAPTVEPKDSKESLKDIYTAAPASPPQKWVEFKSPERQDYEDQLARSIAESARMAERTRLALIQGAALGDTPSPKLTKAQKDALFNLHRKKG